MIDKILHLMNKFFDVDGDGGSPLVRMFEVEYSKEYKFAKKCGFKIDERFVRDFLSNKY